MKTRAAVLRKAGTPWETTELELAAATCASATSWWSSAPAASA